MTEARPSISVPDGGWGWIVMVASFFTALFIFGVLTSGGLMYIAIMNEFRVSRPQAAFVPNLAFSISCFMGPVASSLSSHFTHRVVIFAGALLAAIGVIIAAIFPTFMMMTIFYGGVMGFGCGLTLVPNTTIVHTYFHRHRGFASSFAIAGAAIGSTLVPLLIEWVNENHGLSGCLLTIGALLLQICPCAMLMRPVELSLKRPMKEDALMSRRRFDETGFKKINETENSRNLESNELFQRQKEFMKTDNQHSMRLPEEKKGKNIFQRILSLVDMDPTIFRNKYFYLMSFSMMAFSYAYLSYLTILPDYVNTEAAEPVSLSMAVLLISFLSLGDLVSRILSGWLMDQRWVNRRCAYMLFLFGEGTLLIAHFPSHTYSGFITVAILLGMCIGGPMILPPILMYDLLGRKRFQMAIGIAFALSGIVVFFAAPSIVYIREIYGSYKPCVVVISAVIYFTACIWALDFLWIYCIRRSPLNNNTQLSIS